MNQIIEKIKSKGYWRVVIRPSTFVKERIIELGRCSQQRWQYEGEQIERMNRDEIRIIEPYLRGAG